MRCESPTTPPMTSTPSSSKNASHAPSIDVSTPLSPFTSDVARLPPAPRPSSPVASRVSSSTSSNVPVSSRRRHARLVPSASTVTRTSLVGCVQQSTMAVACPRRLARCISSSASGRFRLVLAATTPNARDATTTRVSSRLRVNAARTTMLSSHVHALPVQRVSSVIAPRCVTTGRLAHGARAPPSSASRIVHTCARRAPSTPTIAKSYR